jgi:anti-sigma factor RsiW
MRSTSGVRAGAWTPRCLLRYRAPAALRQRIAIELQRRSWWREAASRLRNRWFGPARLAAPFAAGLLLGAIGLSPQPAADARDAAGREVVASHVRSLAGAHRADVRSGDGDVVKSWFLGKLDYSPEVPDLSASGYSLAGARLDYVDDRFVAAVVYLNGRHLINVFSCPMRARRSFEGALNRSGFAAFAWTHASRQYWAVADLGPAELRVFADAFRGAVR